MTAIRHSLDIDLTKLKEVVKKYWSNPEDQKKFFHTYTDKDNVKHTILRAGLVMHEPKYSEKADGSKIESQSGVLHDTGFASVSKKVGDEYETVYFGDAKRWIDKVDTTPPQDDNQTSPDDGGNTINVDDIPF